MLKSERIRQEAVAGYLQDPVQNLHGGAEGHHEQPLGRESNPQPPEHKFRSVTACDNLLTAITKTMMIMIIIIIIIIMTASAV
jgi:hypothetical protein